MSNAGFGYGYCCAHDNSLWSLKGCQDLDAEIRVWHSIEHMR
jgi:hypothetical protein